MDREEYIRKRKLLNPDYEPVKGTGTLSKEEFIARREVLRRSSDELFDLIEMQIAEADRTIDILHNAESILRGLDEEFEKRTSLTKTDWTFLMLATALQLVRIHMLPKYKDKIADEDRLAHDDPSIKEMERGEIQKYKDKHKDKWKSVKSEKGYRSWQEIAFTIKVPYDATRHSGEGFHDRNMHGGQHRVKTLGHDPILGWVFGVANIISDTITICPEFSLGEKKHRLPHLESYTVDMGSGFCWKERTPTASVFSKSWESIGEDKHRLYAAVFSQGLHLASDKFTKMGLPIPFLSLLDADKAYEIYKEGYDYITVR